MTIKEKGKAAMIMAFCSAASPPMVRSSPAMRDTKRPQTIFTLSCGMRLPFSDSMDNTKVAESADVMKKINSSNTVITERAVLAG